MHNSMGGGGGVRTLVMRVITWVMNSPLSVSQLRRKCAAHFDPSTTSLSM